MARRTDTRNGVTMQWFTFEELVAVPELQRSLDPKHVKRILADYHGDLANFPLVCIVRGGICHIADGHHTFVAYQVKNPTEKGMWCRVTKLPPDEVFNRVNTTRKAANASVCFWTSYGNHRDEHVDVFNLCEEIGITLEKGGGAPHKNCCKSPAKLLELYRNSPTQFKRRIQILAMFKTTQGEHSRAAWTSEFICGFMDFITSRPPGGLRQVAQSIRHSGVKASDIKDNAFYDSRSSSTRYISIAAQLTKICS